MTIKINNCKLYNNANPSSSDNFVHHHRLWNSDYRLLIEMTGPVLNLDRSTGSRSTTLKRGGDRYGKAEKGVPVNRGGKKNTKSINGTGWPCDFHSVRQIFGQNWRQSENPRSPGRGPLFYEICKDRTPSQWCARVITGFFFIHWIFLVSRAILCPARFELFPDHLKSCDHRLSTANRPRTDQNEK